MPRLARVLVVVATAVLLVGSAAPEAASDPDDAEPRVVNGTLVPAASADWEFAVTLVERGESPFAGSFCGGTLVAPDVVVTAAHCVDPAQGGSPADDFYVYAGSRSLAGPFPPGRMVGVSAVALHPQWDGFAKDLALVRLATPLELPTATLAPADTTVSPGTPTEAAGWGCTQLHFDETSDPNELVATCDAYPARLREAVAPMISRPECSANYVSLVGRFDSSSMLCAGTPSTPGAGPDTCWGDSGGPLVMRTDTSPTLVGVTSRGVLCGFFPGIYADVSRLRPFIDETMAAWAATPAGPPLSAPPVAGPYPVLPGSTLGTFTPVEPARLLDTRTISNPLSPGELRSVAVAAHAGVPPAELVDTVALNVTAVNPRADGFVTAFPCGQSPPTVSSVNYVAGQTVANAVTVGVSDAGTVCLTSFATTDVVVDVSGWTSAELDGDVFGGRFTPAVPTRVVDTRAGASLNANGVVEVFLPLLDVSSGVIDFTTAVTLNVTAVNPRSDGYLTVYPCGAVPTVSSVNYVAGRTVANAVTVPTAVVIHDGKLAAKVCVTSFAETDVVVDVTGRHGLPGALDGGRIAQVSPTRLIDTRDTVSVPAGHTLALQAVGRAGIPEGATAAVVNLTAVNPAADGFLTAFPCGSDPPTSSVNYLAGEIVANLAFVPLAPDGSICVYSYAATDVVVDVTAFVAP